MKKFGILIAVVLLTLVMLAAGCAKPAPAPTPAPTPAPKPLPTQITYAASAPTTSSWYPMHAKVAELGGKAMGINVTVSTPGGAEAVTQLVFDGGAATGGSAYVTHYQMIKGLGKWDGKPQPNRLRVLHVHSVAINGLVVRADSGINDLTDLTGKTVYPGFPGSTTYGLWVPLLESLGIQYKEFVGELPDAISGFKDKRIDAFIKGTSSHKLDASHIDIMTTTPIKFIGPTEAQVKTALAKYEWLPFQTYAKGWYTELPNQEAHIALSIPMDVVVRDDFPEELAYKWTKGNIENWSQVSAVFAGSAIIDPLKDTTAMALPGILLHPGSIRYLRERGVQVPDSMIPPEMKK